MRSLRHNWIIFSVATLLGLVLGVSVAHLGMGEHSDRCTVCDLAQHSVALNPDVVVPTVELRVLTLNFDPDCTARSHDPIAQAQPRAPPAS
jgi:hypothetical protein